MDTEATLTRNKRLYELEDTIFQAQFYLRQAMQCQTEDNRKAILRITHQTLEKALNSSQTKLVDL